MARSRRVHAAHRTASSHELFEDGIGGLVEEGVARVVEHFGEVRLLAGRHAHAREHLAHLVRVRVRCRVRVGVRAGARVRVRVRVRVWVWVWGVGVG